MRKVVRILILVALTVSLVAVAAPQFAGSCMQYAPENPCTD